MNNRSQAVRLPKEFRVTTKEMFIRKEGEDIILSPRPGSWAEYIANRGNGEDDATDELVQIIETMEDLPPVDKDLF